jgi:hypothetical protein
MLQRAETEGGLQRALWVRQPRARIALLPPGIDEARVIAALLRHLREEVYRHNKVSAPSARLRLRVAAHEGLTHVQDEVYVGDVIDTTAALVHEPSFTAYAGTDDVAVVVTDRIYSDVIRGRETYDLRPEDFAELRTEHGTAWAHIAAPPDLDPPRGRGPEPAGAGEGGELSIRTRGRLTARKVVGRDYVHSNDPEQTTREPGGPNLQMDAGEADLGIVVARDLIERTDDD